MVKGYYRGHEMYFDQSEQSWKYCDDDTLVKENKDRVCGKCGEYRTEKGHDPCIADLPGVMNACCGHGDNECAYVQFTLQKVLRGEEAIKYFNKAKNKPG